MAVKIGSSSISKVYIGKTPISKIYLGTKLIFDGQQWLWCLVSIDGFYLESSDGYKFKPWMEATA